MQGHNRTVPLRQQDYAGARHGISLTVADIPKKMRIKEGSATDQDCHDNSMNVYKEASRLRQSTSSKPVSSIEKPWMRSTSNASMMKITTRSLSPSKPQPKYAPPCAAMPPYSNLHHAHNGPRSGRVPPSQQSPGGPPKRNNPTVDHPSPELIGTTVAGATSWNSFKNQCYFDAAPAGAHAYKLFPQSATSWHPNGPVGQGLGRG
mmetsp:Transcript_37976/g.72812  ORF Transcript_37976/g.72812 Transcript_37976/m.72812 type:complete len:205 (-) Transcript_37976:348-962(-)